MSNRKIPDVEMQRRDAARKVAQAAGRELLTPQAVSELFGKTPEAIRKAKYSSKIHVAAGLNASNKEVPLFALKSCEIYWGELDPQKIDAMRADSHILSVDGVNWAVLNPTPLLTFNEVFEN